MKSFRQYLTEAMPSSAFDYGDNYKTLIDTLNQNCKKFDSKHPLYRGDDSLSNMVKTKFVIASPGQSERPYARNSEPFNRLVNEVLESRGLPSRNRSIIMIDDILPTSQYGDAVCVIPFDNAKIVVSKEVDVWDTKIDFIGNHYVRVVFFTKFFDALEIPATFDNVKTFSKKLATGDTDVEQRFEKVLKMMESNGFNTPPDAIQEWKSDFYGHLLKSFQDIVDGFKVVNPSNVKTAADRSEMWTDANCVIVSRTIMDDLTKAKGTWSIK